MNDIPICNYILSPSAIEAALVLLKDNDFPLKEYASLGEFTKQVLDFKTKHNVQGLALRAASLQQLAACAGSQTPGSVAHKFAEVLKVRHLANPDSMPYSHVSFFELTAPPRILLASRFAAASSMMRMAKAVAALVVQHAAVLAARVAAKEKLVDMKEELVELYAEFFSHASFPVSAISLPSSKYDARDPKRVDLFSSMCTWQFDSARRHEVVAKYLSIW